MKPTILALALIVAGCTANQRPPAIRTTARAAAELTAENQTTARAEIVAEIVR